MQSTFSAGYLWSKFIIHIIHVQIKTEKIASRGKQMEELALEKNATINYQMPLHLHNYKAFVNHFDI